MALFKEAEMRMTTVNRSVVIQEVRPLASGGRGFLTGLIVPVTGGAVSAGGVLS